MYLDDFFALVIVVSPNYRQEGRLSKVTDEDARAHYAVTRSSALAHCRQDRAVAASQLGLSLYCVAVQHFFFS